MTVQGQSKPHRAIPKISGGCLNFNMFQITFDLKIQLFFPSSLFLVCTFLVFCMPNLSVYYKQEIAGRAVPLFLPLLQTCLTISVYATVAIALTGMTYVRPAGGSTAASTTTTADTPGSAEEGRRLTNGYSSSNRRYSSGLGNWFR